jgi:hypothetical protein
MKCGFIMSAELRSLIGFGILPTSGFVRTVAAQTLLAGLLGCIPDPLKNFVFVKPAEPAAFHK